MSDCSKRASGLVNYTARQTDQQCVVQLTTVIWVMSHSLMILIQSHSSPLAAMASSSKSCVQLNCTFCTGTDFNTSLTEYNIVKRYLLPDLSNFHKWELNFKQSWSWIKQCGYQNNLLFCSSEVFFLNHLPSFIKLRFSLKTSKLSLARSNI